MSRRPRFQMPKRDPDRPKTNVVGPMVAAYYQKPGNGAGGNLHVVLDDGNIETRILIDEPERCRALGDEEAARIAELMLQMTMTQRRKLLSHKYQRC